MATPKEIKDYRKAMQAWGKACADWQLAHPELNLMEELCKVQTEDSGGEHPPTPPPNP